MSSGGGSFRGLTIFIGDIRNATSKEAEQARVRKELANIRKHFTGTKTLSVYNRKKYVWKLVYIHLLGYEVDFGHVEVINLVSAGTYAEKVVGYLAASVLLSNTDEQITLIVQSIRNDLQSPKDEMQCLALSAIANIGGNELAESLAPDVQRSALCMLRLYRVNRETLPVIEWADRIVTLLRDGRNLGVLLSVTSLVLGVIDKDPSLFESAVPQAVLILTQLVVSKICPPDYLYHGVPCPWLQVALLRLLSYFPLPSDATVRSRLNEVITVVLTHTEISKSVNKSNSEHAPLFEAINIVIKQGEEGTDRHRQLAMKHLCRFVNIREPNIRYLGLETMARMAELPGTGERIRKQQAAIMVSLKDADISLRRRALDLLFAMCDKTNAQEIVRELLAYLVTADYAIKDEMVLKTAILAERYAPDLKWYLDTVVQMLVGSGDHVSDDVWHRAVQIITNNEDLQAYAARKMYNASQPSNAHETLVKATGYILGEFGFLLNDAAETGGEEVVSGAAQFAALEQHFEKVSAPTKAILLSSFIKMQNLYPELQPTITAINDRYSTDLDAELQQRAVEYRAMPTIGEAVMSDVLDSMPPFPADRASILEARLERAKAGATDRDRWAAATGADDDAGSDGDDSSVGDDASIGGASGGSPAAGAGAGAGVSDPAPAAPEVDLLGFGSEPAATAAPPAHAPVAAPTVPVTKRIGIDPSQAPTLRRQFQALTTASKGVLFEDDTVAVGVASQFKGAAGRITLFFRNKASVPLTTFKLRVPPQPQLRVTVADVPTAIDVKQQAQVALTVEAMQPFSASPALQVSFVSVPGTGHAYPLRVPAVLSNFIEPVALEPADFDRRWAALAGEPKELRFNLPAPSGADGVRDLIVNKLHLSPVAAPSGVRGAGSFRTMSTSRTGEKISVGCLAHALVNPGTGELMVCVRTQVAAVTEALKEIIAARLSSV